MRWPVLRGLRTRSLRTRFGLWVAVLVMVAVAALGAYVFIDVGRWLRGTLDDSLRVDASVAAATVTSANGALVLGKSTPDVNSELQVLVAEGDTVTYLDATGAVLGGFGLSRKVASNAGTLAAARTRGSVFSNAEDGTSDRDCRVYTVPVTADGATVGYVQVIHDLQSVSQTLARLLAALLIGGAIITVGAGFAGYLLAGRALAPIDTITRTARRISAQDLSARLNLSGAEDEVGRLASTFDDMLERLDESFQRERRFTADASHELRTPLAAMEAILSVVRSERRTPAEYEQALDDLAEETARLRALVEDLLQLARGGQPANFEPWPVDISAMCGDVTDALRPLADAKGGLLLVCRAEPGLIVRGDDDSLVRLLLNLVENAIKFTETGRIDVSATAHDDDVVVEVADTGVGIPPEELAEIFERFHRADRSRSTSGAGLGLSLARQIVKSHSGTITVRSREGQGSTFTVTLPREAG